eukprot:scaffold228138_cov39-Attheya_sp.AAC.1
MGSNGSFEVNTTDIHGNTSVTRGHCTIVYNITSAAWKATIGISLGPTPFDGARLKLGPVLGSFEGIRLTLGLALGLALGSEVGSTEIDGGTDGLLDGSIVRVGILLGLLLGDTDTGQHTFTWHQGRPHRHRWCVAGVWTSRQFCFTVQ